MITVLLVVLILILIAGFGFVIFMLNARMNELKTDSGVGLLKQDLQNLNQTINQSQSQLHERIDKGQAQMFGSLHKQMNQSAQLITEVTQRLTKLDETNRQVVDVTAELKTLQNILQNPKQRGGLGEFYLETVIGNVLPTGQYQMQYEFKNGEKVDAVIFLDNEKILPIDSKFSLENYNRLVEETDKDRREALAKAFKQDLKGRIDETSKYIRPSEKTMDFALMFIPSEAIYHDLLSNKVGVVKTSSQDLIEYAFRQKRVVIVSPTTFLAYLQTIMQGLRSLKIEEQAKEIQIRVGQLGKHLIGFEEYMHKLGNSLGTTVNHFNSAHKELKKVDKDVVKIAATEAAIEPLTLEKPQSDDQY